jgi:retron-type reverse transcriptase
MACKIVIEPIFEADFEDCSYGFRPKRSAHDAIKRLKQLLNKGYREVYDADLSQYFDTIPHAPLMELIERRISDHAALNLIRLWLKTPVAERTEKGRLRYTAS